MIIYTDLSLWMQENLLSLKLPNHFYITKNIFIGNPALTKKIPDLEDHLGWGFKFRIV